MGECEGESGESLATAATSDVCGVAVHQVEKQPYYARSTPFLTLLSLVSRGGQAELFSAALNCLDLAHVY